MEFKLYLIKEFQRLKDEEHKQLGWDIRRNLAKINYRIHTDAIKENLIPAELTRQQINIIYASEADVLNMAFLGRHYRESFYVRELAKTLSIGVGSASGQLRELSELGFVTSEQKGRTLLYHANISNPLVREAKILAALLELSPLITHLKTHVSRMILFGSCAHGEDSNESDIDLFIETADRPAVQHQISRNEKILSRKLSPIIVSPEESAQLRTRDRPLYERIRQGRVLAGEQL